MKPEPKIALAEWLAEMQRLSARSDEGLTTEEWGAEMGLSKDYVLERLKKASRAGWLIVGRRVGENLIGKKCYTPVYQIVKRKADKTVPRGRGGDV